jgi:SAM-dependent methyltransferase
MDGGGDGPTRYFDSSVGLPIRQPSAARTLASRAMFPLLSLLSREQSVRLRLVPIDDERVIMALRYARGRVLDVGCGANNFVRSYGDGVGVDVHAWEGVDQVVKDAADLPFADGTFGTVSFLACLNHIPNRAAALGEAYRVMEPGGRLLVTMIPPGVGRFVHWLRFRNDPDHRARTIDHDHELLGMHSTHVRSLITDAGFTGLTRRRFVYGINSIYVGRKPTAPPE